MFAISPHGVFIAIGFLIGAWLLGRISYRWDVTGRDDQRGGVLVADRGDHRVAALLRDRALLRFRQRGADARDLARRHLAAGRHRRRRHHQRAGGCAARGTGSSRSPTRWRRRWRWASRWAGSATSSSPTTWASRPAGSWRGSTEVARSRRRSVHRRDVHRRSCRAGTERRSPVTGAKLLQHAVTGPGREPRSPRRRGSSDRAVRHDAGGGAVPVPVVRDDAPAPPGRHPDPHLRSLVRTVAGCSRTPCGSTSGSSGSPAVSGRP